MSDGTKFWGRMSRRELKDGYAALVGEIPQNWGNNRVTTREYGDIPGIVKAYDIHVDVPLEVMQRETRKRADEFCRLLETCDAKEFKNHPFHYTDVPLSVIQNPSAR